MYGAKSGGGQYVGATREVEMVVVDTDRGS